MIFFRIENDVCKAVSFSEKSDLICCKFSFWGVFSTIIKLNQNHDNIIDTHDDDIEDDDIEITIAFNTCKIIVWH